MIPFSIASEHAVSVPKVDIGHNESTYAIANWIMELVYKTLDFLGLEHHHTLFIWIYAIFVFLIAMGVGFVVKWMVMGIVELVGKKVKAQLYTDMRRLHFFPHWYF